ncbi:MAG: heat-inducible transcriptional repressor HrcA [Nitrospirae bacterium]|nr:heat-inducible transcriptional repressor HrcA [Nitrospirota bacterium]MCL5236655.1 heat-inducible transcriptional repressor HrcA [Nitrospirota bacterium]
MVFDMLDDRSKQVLCAVVQSYINSPEPVGSRFVTKKYPLGCSPATIRNIMADLEEFGFLSQPHTSAGRVPTDRGYRFFVDTLLNTEKTHEGDEISKEFVRQFTRKLEGIKNDLNVMFSEATNTLSVMSSYVGVLIPPQPEKITFKKIDLIRYKGSNVVVILLTDEGIIKNRVMRVDPLVTQEDLSRIADYLNSEFSGLILDDIRGMLVKRMKDEKVLWDKLISKAIKVCEQALSFSEDEIFVSGLYDVMDLPDFSNIARIKELSRAIKDKHTILKLLDEFSDAEGVQVVIGDENPVEDLRNLSIVTAPYKEGNRPMGVIALIGPTRMDYLKAISMVGAVAKCVSRTFRD